MIAAAVITFIASLVFVLAVSVLPLPGSESSLSDLIDDWLGL